MLGLGLNDPRRIILIVTLVATATITGAWGFEILGYAPCELCLQQRWAYYVGVPLSVLVGAALFARWTRLGAMGLALVAALFLGSAIFAAWHAGVEWRLWAGPNGCTGAFTKAADTSDFLRQLETTKLVRCDEVAIRILGLSLAGWNAVISLGLSALAAIGARAALVDD